MLVVRPRAGLDRLWAMEQALRSGACAAVLGWARRGPRSDAAPPEAGGGRGRHARASCCGPSVHRDESSPAALRLALTARDYGLDVEILKSRAACPRASSACRSTSRDCRMLEERPAPIRAGSGESSARRWCWCLRRAPPVAGATGELWLAAHFPRLPLDAAAAGQRAGARGRRHRAGRSAPQPSSPATSAPRARASRPA